MTTATSTDTSARRASPGADDKIAGYTYLYDLLENIAEKFPDKQTFFRRVGGELQGRSFSEIKSVVDRLTVGLVQSGLEIGDRVLYLCDSSANWLLADLAIITSGGVSVPRGTDVTDDDIIYIATHSGSKIAFVQKEKDRERLKAMKGKLADLKKIYVVESDDGDLFEGEDGLVSLMKSGEEALKINADLARDRLKLTDPRAMATLTYTSGTTGTPKGVMSNQRSWLYTLTKVSERIGFGPEDRVVSLLPPWHVFERGLEYGVLMHGISAVITDPTKLKDELKDFQPTVFPSVPRIWETVYNGIIANVKKQPEKKQKLFFFFLKIGAAWAHWKSVLLNYDKQVTKPFFLWHWIKRGFAVDMLLLLMPLKFLANKLVFSNIKAALGGKLRVSVSGGSALPGVVDHFLSAIGITVTEGYGMTETSAVISVREASRPAPGTVGPPLSGYQLRLKDDQGNIITGVGKKGTLWVKSEMVHMGYYKRDELNKVVFDSDGFFDTGDIMMLNWRGELMFAGRAKDTIALMGGENIEPVPIEDKLLTSEYIDQVMVVGDDKKTLGALIVPNFDQVKADVQGIPADPAQWNDSKEVRAHFKGIITNFISKQNGFKSFEVVPGNCFYIMPRNFDEDTEMTRTLKMKRPVIKENLEKEINGMYR